MPPKPVAPAYALRAFSCPHCGAFANQSWFKTFVDWSQTGAPSLVTPDQVRAVQFQILNAKAAKEKTELEALFQRTLASCRGDVQFTQEFASKATMLRADNLVLSKCSSCNQVAVWRHDALIYPAIRYEVEPNADLPDEIRADFNEARAVFDTSPRAAAALLRLCIQKLCTHLGEKGNNINDDIGSLVEKGLPATVQKALDLVRVVGNNAVHPGTLDLNDDRETAAKLFVLVNMVAEKLITEPKAVAALFDEKVPQSIKNAIARRDATKP